MALFFGELAPLRNIHSVVSSNYTTMRLKSPFADVSTSIPYQFKCTFSKFENEVLKNWNLTQNVIFWVQKRNWANDLFVSRGRCMCMGLNHERNFKISLQDLVDFCLSKNAKNHFFRSLFSTLSPKKYLKKVPSTFLSMIFGFLTPKNIRSNDLRIQSPKLLGKKSIFQK